MTPPNLNDLMKRYLSTRASVDAAPQSEVEPHEVAGGFRATAAATWTEALAAIRFQGVEPEKVAMPPEWAALAALETPLAAVPLAAGLFPQRARQVPVQFASGDLTALRPTSDSPAIPGFSALRGWLQKALKSQSPTQLLLASGIAATLGDWTTADAALCNAEPLCGGAWRGVWENQQAAVGWLRGQRNQTTWATFNRGMAELFAGAFIDANTTLQEANAKLPDSSGWRHLAQLYATLAKFRAS